MYRTVSAFVLFSAVAMAQGTANRPDGLYGEIRTNKGLIVVRLEPDLAPIAVANFVGLAEGTIANVAFDPGRPFFDGTVYHRVVPGHVIQTGVPASNRAKDPGYSFPNEINVKLSHNHAGALNMANSGPGTNGSQFCIMLGDRSYLDGNYTVFGDTVQGLDVVMQIVQGDVVESVRIVRVGAKAQSFHPTTESFQEMVTAAKASAAEHIEKKAAAEKEWVARNYPQATDVGGGVLLQELATGKSGSGPLRVRYHARQLHYVGDVVGHQGPPLDVIDFNSTANGTPSFEPPVGFTVEPGKTKINPGLDKVLASMKPGDRRIVIVPAAQAYQRAGFYAPEVPGRRRLVISPNTMLVYDIEAIEP